METILVTRREAADLLRLSVRSIDFLISQGRLSSRKVGKRRLIPRAAVERFASHDQARITPASKGAGNC